MLAIRIFSLYLLFCQYTCMYEWKKSEALETYTKQDCTYFNFKIIFCLFHCQCNRSVLHKLYNSTCIYDFMLYFVFYILFTWHDHWSFSSFSFTFFTILYNLYIFSERFVAFNNQKKMKGICNFIVNFVNSLHAS